ncbi:nuclear protein localization protein 4 homolog [Rhopilema esculentum]|uniref:nuclear protein localization protein 4 homolog n=1 Tax=Rhopilema esculentum TaxID=499914 RepID=UPI0031DD19A6
MLFVKEEVQPATTQESSDDWVFEDEIDVTLSKEEGIVHRNRDPQLCHHGPHGKCLHCSPLEPYDEEYLKTLNPPVKHMAFHAYIKKLRSGASRGKFASLEDISCRIKPGCTEHPPWPKGICTKCQPSAITLQRQPYRHVDNIMFENSVIVDRFLNYWRKTGYQRFGILYGSYEKHDNVPLGIRATVSVIYEPPQESTRDTIEFKDDPNAEVVDRVAADLGLRKVGCIFTDLIADETKNGTVKHLRHIGTHFLSAQETIIAADFQTQNPNICKLSSNSKFGSKFVTVVVSGNEENHIHFDGWQVSNQCMALVRDDCLVPTLDDSSLGYVKESSSSQYVPDVFYKVIDTYKNEVTKVARPMPIEFFLIEVPAAFPLSPNFTFPEKKHPFFIENREALGQKQDMNTFMKYIEKFPASEITTALMDFHLLVFLATTEMLPLKERVAELCKALKNKNEDAFHHFTKSEEWATVMQIIAAHASFSPTQESGAKFSHSPTNSTGSVELMDTDQSEEPSWTCSHCTFINRSSGDSCEMCGLPKQS